MSNALGFGVGFGYGGGKRDFSRFSTAKLQLSLLPTGILAASASHGAAVTGWRDEQSGSSNHVSTVGGTPTLYVSGSLVGVELNGSSDVLEGPLVVTDQPCTVFVVAQTRDDNAGGRAAIFCARDGTDTFDRSWSVMRLFTNSAARQGQNDNGNASIASSKDQSAAVVYRAVFTNGSRQLWINGENAASNVQTGGAIRSTVKYRIGQQFGGTQPWNGVAFAVLVYEGAMSLREQEEADADLRSMFGIGDPFVLPGATSQSGDPRFVVPSTTLAIVGREVDFFRDGIHLRDGVTQSLIVTSELPLLDSTADRVKVKPLVAGSYALTFAEGIYSATTTIVAVDPIPALAPQKVVLVCGDSNAGRARTGWMQVIKNRLGSRILFVGTKGPVGNGFTEKNEGIDSTKWSNYDAGATAEIPTGSPFWVGGAGFDIPGYLALLTAAPDCIIFNLGQNDAYTTTLLADVPTTFAASMAHAENIFAAWRVELPDLLFGIDAGYPLASDPSLWNNKAQRDLFHEKMHKWNELGRAYFAGRESSGFYFIDTYTHLDCMRGYPIQPDATDPIHYNASPGHEAMADVQEAFLAHHVFV